MEASSAAPDPDLVRRVRDLMTGGRRRLLGITGAPGAGKSTLAEELVTALGGLAVLVGMDGFHLSGAELRRLGRHARKGAPDTFDVGGYVSLLTRLRAAEEDVVYAPCFDRQLEESIAGAIAVPRTVPLVVTEGNYLLMGDGAWSGVRPLLDECWYLEAGEDERVERLITRHQRYGRSAREARERSLGSDQANAAAVAATRDRADVVVTVGSGCVTEIVRPHQKADGTSRYAAPMADTWTWSYLDSDGAPMTDLGLSTTGFPTQGEAEAWLGEEWATLADAGVGSVTLMNGEQVAYGPMSLSPSAE